MWICLNNAFLSIVDKAKQPGHLLVRARRPGDIERVFGQDVRVWQDHAADYRYRAEIHGEAVKDAVCHAIDGINYPNFKDSVTNKRLHDAYARVWGVMESLQPGGAYNARSGRSAGGYAGDGKRRNRHPGRAGDLFGHLPEDFRRRGGRTENEAAADPWPGSNL